MVRKAISGLQAAGPGGMNWQAQIAGLRGTGQLPQKDLNSIAMPYWQDWFDAVHQQAGPDARLSAGRSQDTREPGYGPAARSNQFQGQSVQPGGPISSSAYANYAQQAMRGLTEAGPDTQPNLYTSQYTRQGRR